MENIAMNKALISAQKCVLSAVKDGNNPAFKSKYATLDSVLAAVRGPLCDNGFALIQDATSTNDSVSVITRLLHESGAELVSQPLSAPLKKEFTRDGKECPPSVQQIGSLVTYLRRYSLCPFLGVSLDDDDDGNHASQIGKDEPQTAAKTERPALRNPSRPADVKTDEAHKPVDQKPVTQPSGKGDVNSTVANAALRDALNRDCIVHNQLAEYLRGEFGTPKISKPMLSGSMGVAALGERIVSALLDPKNWGMVVTRIKADPAYLPF